ncbi:MAG: PhzF family phenazine biosynthesis protein [Chloroflexota bacterium]
MLALIHVDAFTDHAFGGNPAAVCLLESAVADAGWMQAVAAELNLAATTFVAPSNDDRLGLRWFSPTTELELCGHGTLAAAHALFERGEAARDEALHFTSRSGVLTARRSGALIEMDFAAEPSAPATAPRELLDAFDRVPIHVERNRLDYLLELDSEDAVRAVRPNFARLLKVATRGVMVTAQASAASGDFVSRFFAPSAGIDEDPVTGSARLGPYWQRHLEKAPLVGVQLSARGGTVHTRMHRDRVLLGGQAVTVMRAELS